MRPKDVIYGDEARAKIKAGIDKLAKAVVTTLGPRGRNVALERSGIPVILKDGVSVAKEMFFEDNFENMGAQLVKEAASKTADLAGDGTTTATLLTQQIFNEGVRQITAGANPMIMLRGMNKAVSAVVDEIKKMSRPVPRDDIEKIKQVASISAADEQLGATITEAVMKVGEHGVVTVSEGGNKRETTIEYTEGMEFNRGWFSNYFVNDHSKQTAEYKEPLIIISDKKLTDLKELIPFLQEAIKVSKHIVFIAESFTPAVEAMFVANMLKGAFYTLPIRCPEFGNNRKEVLEDLCVLTGAKIISDSVGKDWKGVTLADAGRAESIWADKEKTRIIGGRGDKASIKERISSLEVQSNNDKLSKEEKEKIKERLAKLTSGVAVIRVGATTEADLRDRKERVIDAVAATKAALEEGIIIGGGVALLRAREAIRPLLVDKSTYKKRDEEYIGADIIYTALSKPLEMIAINSGEKGDVVVNSVEYSEDPEYGFDAVGLDFGNMFEKGIIDPAKVTRLALESAASVAIIALTTEALVADKKEENQNPQNTMTFGGMM